LGLRRIDGEVLDNNQPLRTNELSKDGTQRCAIHLLVQLLIVILRTRSEGHTTTTPDRPTAGTGTSTTGALLTPRALTATGNVRTGLLLLAALTTASHVGDYSLMHQR